MIYIPRLESMSVSQRARAVEELELCLAAEPGCAEWDSIQAPAPLRPSWEAAVIDKMILERGL